MAPPGLRAGPADRGAGRRQPRPAGRRARRPRPDHVGRHVEACQAASLEVIARAERFIAERGTARSVRADRAPASSRCRPTSAAGWPAALAPDHPGPVLDRPPRRRPLHRQRRRARLRSSARPSTRLAPLGTSCPDHFIRTKVRPLLLDLPPTAPVDDLVARLRELHAEYRADYAAYYRRHATRRLAGRCAGADPVDRARARRRHVQLRRRRRGPRASPASSTSTRST